MVRLMYLTGKGNTAALELAARTGQVGLLITPATDYRLPGDTKGRDAGGDWPTWAADNGAFNADTYVGDEAWFAWLQGKARHAASCLFATAPDVVGDAAATLERSLPWLPRIRALGYRAAYVAQDGIDHTETPWDAFDVLFIGGTTGWKLGAGARALVGEAHRRGKPVHMGRVNTERRFRYAKAIGCDTADGTFLAFGSDANMHRLEAWIRSNDQHDLFAGTTW